MNKILLTTTGVVAAVAIAGIIYWSNTPLKTYYPNGSLRSEVDRSFFIKKGQYVQYLQNGGRFTVNYVNGKKEGAGKITLKKRVLFEVPFKNGKMDGEIIANEFETGINVHGNNFESTTPFGTVSGKVICDIEDFVEKTTASAQEAENIENGLKCLTFEKMASSADLPVNISFNGSFTYPKFNKTSTFEVTDEQGILSNEARYNNDIPEEFVAALENLKVKRILLTVDKNNKDITLQSFGAYKKPISELKIDAYDIPALISTIKDGILTRNEDNIFNAVKNISLTGFEINTSGKDADLVFKGKITPVLFKVEKGTNLKAFNPKGKKFFAIEALEDGFEMQAKYPNSTKKLLNFKLKVKESPLKDIQRTAASATSPNDYAKKMQNLDRTIEPKFSGELKEFEIFTFDGKSLINTKDFKFDIENKVMNGKVVLFDGQSNEQTLKFTSINAPVSVKMKNGADKTIDFDEVPDYVGNQLKEPMVEKVFKPWIEEAGQIAKEHPASLMGAFFSGAIDGYSAAMNRYSANSLIDYTIRCVVVAQTSSKPVFGNCSQQSILNETADYEVEILPFSTQDKTIVQISNLPRNVCRALEDRMEGNPYAKLNASGCPDTYNDVIITFDN
ncbi:MAG: toxin-antitoxin system YwqK family antitoxin [Alphaproteobacteria bacterium]